jgi:hypothetical protein
MVGKNPGPMRPAEPSAYFLPIHSAATANPR